MRNPPAGHIRRIPGQIRPTALRGLDRRIDSPTSRHYDNDHHLDVETELSAGVVGGEEWSRPSPLVASKPSKVEAIKLASQYLKTFVADEIGNGASHFTRGRRDRPEVPRLVPAGRPRRPHAAQEGGQGEGLPVHGAGPDRRAASCTADQYLACDHLAETVGNGTLRITTRQEFQLHGVLKDDLKATIRTINESLLSTLAACGDVERNVLCCPAPLRDAVRDRLLRATPTLWASHCRPEVVELLGHLARRREDRQPAPARRPRSRCRRPATTPVEPIYGKAYLPRKFKTAFALPEDNCTDIHANDLGYLGDRRGRRARRLQRPGRRRPRHDARAPEDVPVPGRAALLRRPRRRARRSARRC